ncbi:hypothetical protein K438DRAFT_1601038, partial [Mycena galopus ATCC 62051]
IRRSTTRETVVEDHDALVRKWWEWWMSLAPDWRERDENGRPKVGEGAGEWGALAHPGANGVLMVLLPLVWWRRGETSAVATEDWLAAVCDVLWVLQGLLATTQG